MTHTDTFATSAGKMFFLNYYLFFKCQEPKDKKLLYKTADDDTEAWEGMRENRPM